MNQSPLDWPVALSTHSDTYTAGAGLISEMDMGDSCKISVRILPSKLKDCLVRFTEADLSVDRCYGTGTP